MSGRQKQHKPTTYESAKITWEPRNCALCGFRVLKPNGFWKRNLGGNPIALHHHCASEYEEGRS